MVCAQDSIGRGHRQISSPARVHFFGIERGSKGRRPPGAFGDPSGGAVPHLSRSQSAPKQTCEIVLPNRLSFLALQAKTTAKVVRAPVLVQDADFAVVNSEASLLLAPPRNAGALPAGGPGDDAAIPDLADRSPVVSGEGPVRLSPLWPPRSTRSPRKFRNASQFNAGRPAGNASTTPFHSPFQCALKALGEQQSSKFDHEAPIAGGPVREQIALRSRWQGKGTIVLGREFGIQKKKKRKRNCFPGKHPESLEKTLTRSHPLSIHHSSVRDSRLRDYML